MTKEKPPSQILVSIAKVLDELKISYYITGGFAVSVWARPRFTADIDIIIKMQAGQKQNLAQKLQKLFPKGYVDQDQIDSALARQGEFNIVDPQTGLKIDFWIAKEDEFEKSCFKNSKAKDILDYKVNFISPEDLILSKLIWYKQTHSSRHLEDAQTVFKLAKTNKIYLQKWSQKLEVEDSLTSNF